MSTAKSIICFFFSGTIYPSLSLICIRLGSLFRKDSDFFSTKNVKTICSKFFARQNQNSTANISLKKLFFIVRRQRTVNSVSQGKDVTLWKAEYFTVAEHSISQMMSWNLQCTRVINGSPCLIGVDIEEIKLSS